MEELHLLVQKNKRTLSQSKVPSWAIYNVLSGPGVISSEAINLGGGTKCVHSHLSPSDFAFSVRFLFYDTAVLLIIFAYYF